MTYHEKEKFKEEIRQMNKNYNNTLKRLETRLKEINDKKALKYLEEMNNSTDRRERLLMEAFKTF